MIRIDDGLKFSKAILNKFKELIDTGVLKLMPGNPIANSDIIETTQPLALIPVASLTLDVVSNTEIQMTSSTSFKALRPGTVTYWMLDCRHADPAQDNGYITGAVSYTGSSAVDRAAAELQLNTLLISVGDGGALSEITPVQFSIKLG